MGLSTKCEKQRATPETAPLCRFTGLHLPSVRVPRRTPASQVIWRDGERRNGSFVRCSRWHLGQRCPPATVGEHPEPFREAADRPLPKRGVGSMSQIPRETAHGEVTSVVAQRVGNKWPRVPPVKGAGACPAQLGLGWRLGRESSAPVLPRHPEIPSQLKIGTCGLGC